MGFGRGAKASAAQRADVKRLRGEGVSVRRIAAEVFGDARYRGRVERILGAGRLAPIEQPAAGPLFEPVDICEMGTTALLRLLLERRLAYWAESPKPPSMSELRSMLDVRRQLEALETIERHRPPRRQPDRTG